MSLSSSQQAMQSLRKGLPGSNPSTALPINFLAGPADLQQQWLELQKKLLQKPAELLEQELQRQINLKFLSCLKTIPLFYSALSGYSRQADDSSVIWQEGSSRLYQYLPSSKTHPAPLLIIPSLINRHYILDLYKDNSFVKFLAENGVETYLASWDEPLDNELEYNLDNYIDRILAMIELIYAKTGQKITLAGYCMGGLLSLAAATHKADKIGALAFLATPWNFHAEEFPRFRLNSDNLQSIKNIMDNYSKIPAIFMQSLFYYTNAHIIGHKFEVFPALKKTDSLQTSLLAIENWVNDGISMTKPVMNECFFDWVENNIVARLGWESKGIKINPGIFAHVPAFFAIASRDNIVPASCALPLADYFINSKIIQPSAGHIGMLVGNNAKTQTWDNFLEWLLFRSKI